jgi:suppressor of ftsI
MRTRALVIPLAVVGLVVFIIMAVVIGVGPTVRPPTAAGVAPSSPSPKPADRAADESVPTTFKTEQRRPFEAPVELQSENGMLRTAFTVEPTTFPVAGATIKGYAYQGQYIGPTLRVHPGDTVRIDLTNRLGQPTNLHGHGMFISPIGTSDNVLRVMKSKTFNHVVWKLPSDIEPGTYWYHSHLHGLVEEQIFAGLSGVLIVDGLEELLPPALQTVQQYVVALKDLQVKNGAIVRSNIDSNAPTTRTVNGQVDPVLTVRTNETQMLRLANIGADIWYRLRLSGTQFSVIAEDANPVAQVWTADELVLPPGKRFDVLVRWPQPGTQTLETLPYSTGPDGDNYPQRRLMTLQVSGDPVPDVAWPTSMAPPSPLATDHVDRTRYLEFSRTPRPTSSISMASSSTRPRSTSSPSLVPQRSGSSGMSPARSIRSIFTSMTSWSCPSMASRSSPTASRTPCRFRGTAKCGFACTSTASLVRPCSTATSWLTRTAG